MRMSTGVILVAAGAIGALVLAKDFVFSGRNTEARQQHWESVLASSLQPGASVDDLQAFARANGQVLHCFSDMRGHDRCAFDDRESVGGTRSRPTRLSVVFDIDDDEVRGHSFTLVQVQPGQ